MHPELGVIFARWLNTSASYKVMQDVLKFKRDEQGKLTKPYHYSNEARLINWAIRKKWVKGEREYQRKESEWK